MVACMIRFKVFNSENTQFSLCYEQLHLEKLLPEFTVQTLLGQKSHLTCDLFDLLCPQTGWCHFLQRRGTLVVVSLVLEAALESLWLLLEIGSPYIRDVNLSHSSRYCGRNESNLLKLSSHHFGQTSYIQIQKLVWLYFSIHWHCQRASFRNVECCGYFQQDTHQKLL
ncbi:uncharacterized protein LOC111345523 [Stylophora pistillata]|uniref:uncharacterized protein LOC111345523 n=1 Tax=Stylophora pistillata TaxID=50429 RepID=UPI000C04F8F2|nr:uncharacterized protein LOC111345523 [Stylophora pistillata]